jgi:hypothetical protein
LSRQQFVHCHFCHYLFLEQAEDPPKTPFISMIISDLRAKIKVFRYFLCYIYYMIERLREDFPEFRWRLGRVFRWRPATKTITLERIAPEVGEEGGDGHAGQKYALLALHELAHALLGHEDDTYDLGRLKCEAAAWELVKTELASRYNVEYDEELAQDMLDTYRSWLHKKSACPVCKQCRFQTVDGGYSCPNGCGQQ